MSEVHLLVVAIGYSDYKYSYKKTMSGCWDFSSVVDDDYVPIYIIDIDKKKVINSGNTCDDPMHEYYVAFTDGLQYSGTVFHESYGVWFTEDGSYEPCAIVLEALEMGLIERAE
jgi:hypothetical protein